MSVSRVSCRGLVLRKLAVLDKKCGDVQQEELETRKEGGSSRIARINGHNGLSHIEVIARSDRPGSS